MVDLRSIVEEEEEADPEMIVDPEEEDPVRAVRGPSPLPLDLFRVYLDRVNTTTPLQALREVEEDLHHSPMLRKVRSRSPTLLLRPTLLAEETIGNGSHLRRMTRGDLLIEIEIETGTGRRNEKEKEGNEL